MDYFAISQILPDPDFVLRKAGKDISVYKEIMADARVSACVTARKAGVLKLKWEIDRGKDKSDKSKIIEDLFKRLNVYKLISDILNAPFYGFQPLEVMWHFIDSLILPEAVIAKPVEWFLYGQENQLKFRPKDNFQGIELPPRKFLNPQHNATYKNPYGERIMSKCFWPVAFKKGGQKFRMLFIEKYGMPFLLGKHPPGASDPEIDDLMDMLEKMVHDAVAAIPDNASVEPLEVKGKSTVDVYESQIISSNREISEAILGQAVSMDVTETGSYAKSQSGIQVMEWIALADQRLVEDTFNQLIQWIDELNWNSDASELPKFSMFEESGVRKDLADRDKTLNESGVQFTKKYYMEHYSLEEQDLEVVPKAPGGEPGFTEYTRRPMKPDQRALDNIELSDKELQSQAEMMLKPVTKMIQKGLSYNDVMEKLAETYPKMKTKDLEELLTRTIFVSQVWGKLNASK